MRALRKRIGGGEDDAVRRFFGPQSPRQGRSLRVGTPSGKVHNGTLGIARRDDITGTPDLPRHIAHFSMAGFKALAKIQD